MHRSDVDFFAINDGHQLGKPEAWHGRIFNVSGQGSGLTRWWCLDIFLFSPENWGRFPFWLIFFKWVETTNYIVDLFFATNTQSLLKKMIREAEGWRLFLRSICSSNVYTHEMTIKCQLYIYFWVSFLSTLQGVEKEVQVNQTESVQWEWDLQGSHLLSTTWHCGHRKL